MASIKIEHRHALSSSEAKNRLQALGDYLSRRHGVNVAWTSENSASVRGKYLIVNIEGKVELAEGSIRFEGKDPGVLWRSKAKKYLEGKLAQYFSANTPLGSLPRG